MSDAGGAGERLLAGAAAHKRIVVAAVAGLVVLGSLIGWQARAARLAQPVDPATLTTAAWQDDLHYLARQLAERHANAFHRISRDQYERLVARIDSTLATRSGWDAAVDLERLTAAVGDAHTYLALPAGQHVFPFNVYYFGDVPLVVRVAPAERAILGARLVRIGDVAMPEVEARLRQILTQGENVWYYRAHYPWFLSREVLHALGVVADTGPTPFTFARPDGTELRVALSASAAAPNDWVCAYETPPLFIRHADDDFWYTALPDSGTVYVAFNSYSHLGANAAKLFHYLDGRTVTRLVVDLRNNGGGDYLVGHKELIAPILARPRLNRRGCLYVITGRFTFSAAMSNAAQFRTETQATLVGEPPGEVPNSYQERRSFRLPHSHLLVNYSTRYYRFFPTDAPALLPDEMIPPDWDDYRAGRDPALDWVLAQPVPARGEGTHAGSAR